MRFTRVCLWHTTSMQNTIGVGGCHHDKSDTLLIPSRWATAKEAPIEAPWGESWIVQGENGVHVDCSEQTASRIPQMVAASGQMEGEHQQQAGALGPLSGDNRKTDVPDSNGYIWIVEETHFAYRNRVYKVNYQNTTGSFFKRKVSL